MNTDATHILIFRTNIRTQEDKLAIKPALDDNRQIEKWTIDLDDIDRVLRIVSSTLCCPDIIHLVTQQGYQCTELD